MASFVLESKSIRMFTRALQCFSKISKTAAIEFKEKKLKIWTSAGVVFVKVVFDKESFFKDYQCTAPTRCYLNLMCLQKPFKSQYLNEKFSTSNNQPTEGNHMTIKCEYDEIDERLIFTISPDWMSSTERASTVTYKMNINDIPEDARDTLMRNKMSVDNPMVTLSPSMGLQDKFLLSGLNTFAPGVDHTTIKIAKRTNDRQGYVKFIGYMSLTGEATSDFVHERSDFLDFHVNQDLEITMMEKHLRAYLLFVEQYKGVIPKYNFIGPDMPAHFIYDFAPFFRARLVISTLTEINNFDGEEDYSVDRLTTGNADQSFSIEEDDIAGSQQYPNPNPLGLEAGEAASILSEDINMANGFQDNRSDEESIGSDDGSIAQDWDRNVLNNSDAIAMPQPPRSVCSESVRSRLSSNNYGYDPVIARQILNLDDDPDLYDPDNIGELFSDDEVEDKS